ncbi:EamA family transporter [Halorubrum sp. Atlit-8R]|uniref:DMT family transporter n=1 Tax=unclassified Halorubrum TaxID=2642239 RepID=UPI000EF2092D|nr:MULTISPECIES: EamA family transporter [unclassified Halorubrum]RLM70897.1 EamA family transporter [Halorubrum sp. Atlit-9R]RLM71765.1 EamA family transporter [Halorubrum sp. Atlit-9R]RLM82950.1 EamA family transporter [Halorubrum sp. Atlit-8R]
MSPGPSRYAFALAPLAAASLWGGMYVVSKWGFALIPPVTLGFLRVTLGAVALLLVVTARGGPPPSRGEWATFAALGGWVTLTVATQFVGTELTNASQGSLLTVLTPVFTVALGALVLGERVTGRKAAGMAVAGVGTAVVLAGRYDLAAVAAGNLLGVALLLLASAAWAGYTVWGVRAVRRHGALRAATYSSLASVPMLGALAAGELWVLGRSPADLPLTAESAGAVLYLGLASTAAAWFLWYKGLEYVSAGTVAVFFFAQPAVGAALGAALLGESLGSGFVAGGALMAVGIWVVGRERADEGDGPPDPTAE